jgi:hypothetical protein
VHATPHHRHRPACLSNIYPLLACSEPFSAFRGSCLLRHHRNAEGRAEAQQSVQRYFLHKAPQVTQQADTCLKYSTDFSPAGPGSVTLCRGPLGGFSNTKGSELTPGMCVGLTVLRCWYTIPALSTARRESIRGDRSVKWFRALPTPLTHPVVPTQHSHLPGLA